MESIGRQCNVAVLCLDALSLFAKTKKHKTKKQQPKSDKKGKSSDLTATLPPRRFEEGKSNLTEKQCWMRWMADR